MDRIWQKTREQARKIDIFIMAAEFLVVLVAAYWIYGGIQEGSLAVAAIGLSFLGFAAWHFYSY